MGAGRVDWIGVRDAHRGGLRACPHADAIADRGLDGDHAAQRRGGRRQVTLIDAASLETLRARLRCAPRPERLRRNIVVSGLDLRGLIGRAFAIGDAVLIATGDCPPCLHMDAQLEPGAMRAMEGLGGICARVQSSGRIRIGDAVARIDLPEDGQLL